MTTPNPTLFELDAEDLLRLKERIAAARTNRATERAAAGAVRATRVNSPGYRADGGRYYPPSSWFLLEGPRGGQFRVEIRPYARRPKAGPLTYAKGWAIDAGTLRRLRIRAGLESDVL